MENVYRVRTRINIHDRCCSCTSFSSVCVCVCVCVHQQIHSNVMQKVEIFFHFHQLAIFILNCRYWEYIKGFKIPFMIWFFIRASYFFLIIQHSLTSQEPFLSHESKSRPLLQPAPWLKFSHTLTRRVQLRPLSCC
jgi:hypothetical protein